MRTDSRILTYLQSKHTSKSHKLLNWALELSEFNFDIVHIESKNNAITDCLTRLYQINAIFQLQPKFSMNDILIAQQNDTFISNAKEYLQTGKAHFDVSKLGPLKRHLKQLHLNEHPVLCWKNRVVLAPLVLPSCCIRTLSRPSYLRTFWGSSHMILPLCKLLLARC